MVVPLDKFMLILINLCNLCQNSTAFIEYSHLKCWQINTHWHYSVDKPSTNISYWWQVSILHLTYKLNCSSQQTKHLLVAKKSKKKHICLSMIQIRHYLWSFPLLVITKNVDKSTQIESNLSSVLTNHHPINLSDDKS